MLIRYVDVNRLQGAPAASGGCGDDVSALRGKAFKMLSLTMLTCLYARAVTFSFYFNITNAYLLIFSFW